MKKLLLTFLVLTGLFIFTACSYEVSYVIHEDGSVTQTNRMWYSFEDIKETMSFAIKVMENSKEELSQEKLQRIEDFKKMSSFEELKDYYQKYKEEGEKDPLEGMIEKVWNGETFIAYPNQDETQEMTAEEAVEKLPVSGIYFDKDTFIFNAQNALDVFDQKMNKEKMSDEDMEEYQAYLASINYLIHITMPQEVALTNGELSDDGKTVTFDINFGSKPQKYYIYTKNSTKLIEFDIQGDYTKNKSVSFSTPDKITSIEVNGSSVTAPMIDTSKDGKYTVSVKTENSEKTISFIKDSTKPTVKGVKNGAVYSEAVTIKYSDNLSGIKSAKLGKKKIKSGTKVTKPGKYTLKVTDNAGNKKTVKFTISK